MSAAKDIAVNLASALERCSGDTELLSQVYSQVASFTLSSFTDA